MTTGSVLWRRLDVPGHEACRFFFKDDRWYLTGAAVFVHDASVCCLDYVVVSDATWRTQSAEVRGWVGMENIAVRVRVDDWGRWFLNEEPCDQVEGCIDVDLNFSPSTNLLPIRRLNLGVGEESSVRAAWLRFPTFRLEPLEQRYTRTGDRSYQYESAGGAFTAGLTVDGAGLVTDYGDYWRAEACE